MKCKHCDKEYSDSVCRIHEIRCKENPGNRPDKKESEENKGKEKGQIDKPNKGKKN